MPEIDDRNKGLTDDMEKPIEPKSGIPFIPEQIDGNTAPGPVNERVWEKEVKAGYGQVRFLNASTNNLPLNILIDNHVFASAVEFGNITPYGKVLDGFRTITIVSALNPRLIFYRKPVPFIKGEPVTMVIVDDIDDIDLVQISDKCIVNINEESGCFRASNMSFETSAYDVMFYSGDTVFSNVRFKETSFFKEAKADKYEFFISKAVNGMEREELPVIKAKEVPFEIGVTQPLYWFRVDIKPGRSYTAYIIGNLWSSDFLRVFVVEN